MGKNEMDDLFSELDDFLSDNNKKKETESGFDLRSVHDPDLDDEPENDRSEVFKEKVEPLVEQICEYCLEHEIPAQFALKVSSRTHVSAAVCVDLSLQVKAAAALYTLPHPISHLVRYSVREPHFPMVEEEAFDRVKESEEIQGMLKELIKTAQDHKIPLQWGMVIRRQERSDPSSFEEAVERVMKAVFSDGKSELAHQDLWCGLHMDDDQHSCAMTAASHFYKVGSALSWEVVQLFDEKHNT